MLTWFNCDCSNKKERKGKKKRKERILLFDRDGKEATLVGFSKFE